jgi:hypothetical protein
MLAGGGGGGDIFFGKGGVVELQNFITLIKKITYEGNYLSGSSFVSVRTSTGKAIRFKTLFCSRGVRVLCAEQS